jgi:hypothetical protein
MLVDLSALRQKVAHALGGVIFGIIAGALTWMARLYSRASTFCQVACFLEIWRTVTGSMPINREAPEYGEINDAVEYYLSRSSNAREAIGFFERRMLRANYARWFLRESDEHKAKRHWRFVLKYRLARIIKNYVNIQHHINLLATEELSPIESAVGEELSAPYWRARVAIDHLPSVLQEKRKPRTVLSYLRRRTAQLKLEIRRSNYPKVDFSLSDLGALLGLSGALLIVLGYLDVAIVNWYFGIPYQRYFGASDYLASSINSVGRYLIVAAISVALVFLRVAALQAYTVGPPLRTFSTRLEDWTYHFIGVAAVVALAVDIYQRRPFPDPLALLIVSLYVGAPLIARVGANFFAKPFKASILLALTFLALVNAVVGAVYKIQRVASADSQDAASVLRFSDADYTERDWAVLAVTSDFVILRRRSGGEVVVRNKADLVRVDLNSGSQEPRGGE